MGVVLLIAITVMLVAIVGAMIADTDSRLEEPTPKVAVDFSFTQDGSNVIVSHESGAILDTNRLELRGPGQAIFSGAELAAGDSFIIQSDSPSEQFDLMYTRDDAPDAVLATAENPLVSDLGGVPPQITLAYEDLSVADSDYDYNDWAFDMQTTIDGYFEKETRHATELSMEFDPLARGGGYNHDQYIVPGELGEGEYDLTVFDGEGTVVRDESGEFDSDTRILLLNSGNAFDSQTNAKKGNSCTAPGRRVELELTLDSPAEIPGNPIDADRQHGAGLPFNPVMEPSGNDAEIGIGDPRLVTVPTNWKWPTEQDHIASAYEDVGPEDGGKGDTPNFEIDTWFQEPTDEDNVFGACR